MHLLIDKIGLIKIDFKSLKHLQTSLCAHLQLAQKNFAEFSTNKPITN